MEFGIQFFPSVGPAETPADRYWSEALNLTRLAEQLGYTSVRTVEHYFHPYRGLQFESFGLSECRGCCHSVNPADHWRSSSGVQ